MNPIRWKQNKIKWNGIINAHADIAIAIAMH